MKTNPSKKNPPKLNYYKFKIRDWQTLCLIVMVFDAWLFKVAGGASPSRCKDGMQFPESPEVLIGLTDLELEDIEVFLPPHLWDEIRGTIAKIESPNLPGSTASR